MKNNQLWLLIGITFILTIMFSVLAVDVYGAETLAYNTTNAGGSTNSNVNGFGGSSAIVAQNFTSIGNTITAVGLNISNWTTTPLPAGSYVNIRILYDSNVISTMANTTNISSQNMPLPLLDNSVGTGNGTYVKFDITDVSLNVSQRYTLLYTFLNSTGSKNVNVRQTTTDYFSGITSTYAGLGVSNYEIRGAMYFDNITPATTYSITLKDIHSSTTLLNTSVNLSNYDFTNYSYSNTTGIVYAVDVLSNSTKLWNITTCSSDYIGYVCRTYQNQNVSSASLTAYLYPQYVITNLSAKDFYDNQSLVNISATFSPSLAFGQSNATTTGTLSVWLPHNTTTTVEFHSTNNGGYFSRSGYSITPVTTNNYLNTSLWQSIASFSGTQKFTGASVGAVQVNVTNQSNTSTLYLKAGTYTASLGATGYFVQPYTFTTTALSSQAFVVENFSNAKLNISALSLLTGASVTTFNASVIALDYGDVYEQTSTTTGSVLFNLTNGTYNVTIDASGYAIDSVLLTVNGSAINYQTFRLYTTNSVNFTFVDEITGANVPNVNASLIGTLAYSFNTTSGNYYLDLISPASYKIRYGASGYTTRFGYISVTNRTSQNQTLYLLPTSAGGSNVTATIIDNTGYPLENALLKILKYKSSTNTYEVVSQVLSNFDGKSLFDAQLNTEFYKFIVEYPVGTVALETTPTYIYTTDLTLVISISDSGAENWYKYSDASTNLDFNDVTNNFRYTYSDTTSSIQQACVYVYYLDNNFTSTLYNSSCSSSSSATILVGVSNITHDVYRADAYLTIDGTKSFDRQLFHQYNKSTSWGASGLIIAILITIVIVFIFVQTKDPNTIILMIPLGLTLTNVFGITHFDIWVPMALWAISLILAYIVSRR